MAARIRLQPACLVYGAEQSQLDGLVTIETEQRSGCPPINIICAIDASGSMEPDEASMRLLIATMIECASRRGGGTYSQVHFANEAHFVAKAVAIPPVAESVEWKQETLRRVGSYKADGATNTYAALVAVTELLVKLPGQSVVFVATDGDPTCGDYTVAEEIALRISAVVKDKQIDCGQFDCVMLGLGPLKIPKFEAIGRGLHPDARFVQSSMSSIAGDIGQALGDFQMFPHAEVRLHNCRPSPYDDLRLRNVKHGQTLHFLVEFDPRPGTCAAEFVADNAVLCEATCSVQIGETEQKNVPVAWLCAKLRATGLVTAFCKNKDASLLDQAVACVADFASPEADLLRQMIANARVAPVDFAHVQQLNGLRRELTRSATQSQQDYAATYDLLKPEYVAPPPSPVKFPVFVSEYLVTTFSSVTELLSKLNNGSFLTAPAWTVKRLIVFSSRVGSYFYVHRTDEQNPCCSSGNWWCNSIRPYPKPVDKLPILTL